MTEALWAGAVPVVISSALVQPFSNIVNWSDVAVIIDDDDSKVDVLKMVDGLRKAAASSARIAGMQRGGAAVARHLLFHPKNYVYAIIATIRQNMRKAGAAADLLQTDHLLRFSTLAKGK